MHQNCFRKINSSSEDRLNEIANGQTARIGQVGKRLSMRCSLHTRGNSDVTCVSRRELHFCLPNAVSMAAIVGTPGDNCQGHHLLLGEALCHLLFFLV
jgi:hypothetical protein